MAEIAASARRDLGTGVLRLIEILEAWEQRVAQRRALGHLDDRLLADIGRSRADASAEAEKPFWRA